MSWLGCTCGHRIKDNTDFLPYKAYLREDEDMEKPVTPLSDTLVRFWEAREQQRESEFLRDFFMQFGPAAAAGSAVARLEGKPLREILSALIWPFWPFWDTSGRVIFECEECGRLWIQTEVNQFAPYSPETDGRHVLSSRHLHNPHGHLDE